MTLGLTLVRFVPLLYSCYKVVEGLVFVQPNYTWLGNLKELNYWKTVLVCVAKKVAWDERTLLLYTAGS
jgi:hypothetical protein